jgi:transposase, IS5 family
VLGVDRPVPHPTTLVKLVRGAGPEVVDQLIAALLGKLAGDKLLRGRKLRVDTTVVEADVDDPTDADLLEQAVRKVGGLVRRIKGRGAASRTGSGTAAGRLGGGCRQPARTLRRRTGVAMGPSRGTSRPRYDAGRGQVSQYLRCIHVRQLQLPPCP